MRDSKLFDDAVARYFDPIARRLNLPLVKVQEGIYDMPSPHFIMRIRLDTGHARGLNVMLRPASISKLDDDDRSAPQYGIGCFILHHGEKLEDTFIEVGSDNDFLKRAQLLAKATEHYGVPYLLGEGKDWEAVAEMIRKKTDKDLEELRKMNFPLFVQKRWHLPPPKDET